MMFSDGVETDDGSDEEGDEPELANLGGDDLTDGDPASAMPNNNVPDMFKGDVFTGETFDEADMDDPLLNDDFAFDEPLLPIYEDDTGAGTGGENGMQPLIENDEPFTGTDPNPDFVLNPIIEDDDTASGPIPQGGGTPLGIYSAAVTVQAEAEPEITPTKPSPVPTPDAKIGPYADIEETLDELSSIDPDLVLEPLPPIDDVTNDTVVQPDADISTTDASIGVQIAEDNAADISATTKNDAKNLDSDETNITQTTDTAKTAFSRSENEVGALTPNDNLDSERSNTAVSGLVPETTSFDASVEDIATPASATTGQPDADMNPEPASTTANFGSPSTTTTEQPSEDAISDAATAPAASNATNTVSETNGAEPNATVADAGPAEPSVPDQTSNYTSATPKTLSDAPTEAPGLTNTTKVVPSDNADSLEHEENVSPLANFGALDVSQTDCTIDEVTQMTSGGQARPSGAPAPTNHFDTIAAPTTNASPVTVSDSLDDMQSGSSNGASNVLTIGEPGSDFSAAHNETDPEPISDKNNGAKGIGATQSEVTDVYEADSFDKKGVPIFADFDVSADIIEIDVESKKSLVEEDVKVKIIEGKDGTEIRIGKDLVAKLPDVTGVTQDNVQINIIKN